MQRLSSEVGIQGKAHEWFKSYLASRKQCVIINGELSVPSQLTVGVPQGSVLGPLLFLVYMLPLRRIIESFEIQRHSFADDSQLYNYFTLGDPASFSTCIKQVEKCAAAVRAWMISNKLKINDSKTEFLIIAPKKHLTKIMQTHPTITIGTEHITPVHVVRNLGSTFDSTMSMEPHTNIVVRNVFYHIRRVGKIRGHLDEGTATKVLHALITSRLDINNGLLAGSPQSNIRRLQVAHNASARMLTRTKKREHISPVLERLHWLPVNKRILFKILITVYKSLHDSAFPLYMKELISEHKPVRSLRSGDSMHLSVPRSHNTYGDRAYINYAPSAWNALPQNLRTACSLTSFKRLLKTHLF